MFRSLCLFVVFNVFCALGAVLSIDIGSGTTKAAVAQHSQQQPFLIIEDEAAKRKYPSVITFDDDQRFFGTNALGLDSKKPDSSVWFFKDLLGKPIGAKAQVDLIDELKVPYQFSSTDRNSIQIRVRDENISIEELQGMMLKYVKRLGRVALGQVMKDVVVCIPPWFSVQQRQAVLDAAKLAGVNVLGFLHDTSGAALQYGLDIAYDTNTSHVACIFDVGYGSTTASIVKFSAYAKYGKPVGQVEILGVGYDEDLGGRQFDARLLNFLAKRFISKSKLNTKDVYENPRAMKKLLNAAIKLKEVLSANTEHSVYLEGVLNDRDFTTKVTRDEFNELCDDLFDRVYEPIVQASKQAGVSVDQIETFVLIGGSSRIPKIKSVLVEKIGRDALDFSLNADEAGVFGGALRGANMSTTARIRPYGLIDSLPYAIGVKISNLPSTGKFKCSDKFAAIQIDADLNSDTWSKEVLAFPPKSVYTDPKKKLLTFPHVRDVKLEVHYDLSVEQLTLPSDTPVDIADFYVEGVEDALNVLCNSTDPLVSHPQISVSFMLTSAGTVDIAKVSLLMELQKNENETWIMEESLKIRREQPGSDVIKFLSDEDFKSGKELLRKFDEQDAHRKKISKALNQLESLIYTTRDRFSYEETYKKFATDSELEGILNVLEETETWLYENDEDETAEKYTKRIDEIKGKAEDVYLRQEESKSRPLWVKSLRGMVQTVYDALKESLSILEEEDKLELKTNVETIEKWMDDIMLKQDSISDNQDPFVLTKDLKEKVIQVKNLYSAALRKKASIPVPTEEPVIEEVTEESVTEEIPEEEVQEHDEL